MDKKFLFDHNLRKLAKYFCFFGLDSSWLKNPLSIREIKEIVKTENRFFIHTRKDKFSFLNLKVSHDFEEQLLAFIQFFSLKKEDMKIFNRCFPCNQETLPIDRRIFSDKIPTFSYEHGDDFRICPECKKIYWKGSHYQELKKFFEMIFLKYFSRCDSCGKVILSFRTKYKLFLELSSTYDLLEVDRENEKEGIDKSIEELLLEIENLSSEKLESDVYFSKKYLLCNKCRDKFFIFLKKFFKKGEEEDDFSRS